MTNKHNDEEKIKRRLRKLLALADRGAGGEKDNASRMLKKLMQKHGIISDDLISESKKTHWFKHGIYPQKDLLAHIIYSVCDTASCKQRGRFTLGIDCTEYQRAQIELQFSIYKRALKEQIEATVIAFIWKNEILPKTIKPIPEAAKKLSEKEKAIRRAANDILFSIKRTPINLALQHRDKP